MWVTAADPYTSIYLCLKTSHKVSESCFFQFLSSFNFFVSIALCYGETTTDTIPCKIRSFAQFPCKRITCIFIARKGLLLFLLRNGKTSTSRSQCGLFWLTNVLQGLSCCNGHYWERDSMWQTSVFSYIFGLGDCGRVAFKLMFTLWFRHIILVVCVRLSDKKLFSTTGKEDRGAR